MSFFQTGEFIRILHFAVSNLQLDAKLVDLLTEEEQNDVICDRKDTEEKNEELLHQHVVSALVEVETPVEAAESLLELEIDL